MIIFFQGTDCLLPNDMHTGVEGIDVRYGTCVGVVARSPSNSLECFQSNRKTANPGCDWRIDEQLYQAFYVCPDASSAGVKDTNQSVYTPSKYHPLNKM